MSVGNCPVHTQGAGKLYGLGVHRVITAVS